MNQKLLTAMIKVKRVVWFCHRTLTKVHKRSEMEHMYEPSRLHSLLHLRSINPFTEVSLQDCVMLVLHENIRPGVRQPQTDQASPHEHRRGHEDGYGLCDPNKRTKNQVPQDGSQLAQSVAEAKACSSGGEKGEILLIYMSYYKNPEARVNRWVTL